MTCPYIGKEGATYYCRLRRGSRGKKAQVECPELTPEVVSNCAESAMEEMPQWQSGPDTRQYDYSNAPDYDVHGDW